jgi:hypothetical protein
MGTKLHPIGATEYSVAVIQKNSIILLKVKSFIFGQDSGINNASIIFLINN